MYLTYEEYIEFGGTLDETTFNTMSFDAESLIDYYTFSRIRKLNEIPVNVKRLMYRLIQLIYTNQQAQFLGVTAQLGSSSVAGVSGAITSQSNDGFSTTYNTLSASDVVNGFNKNAESLIRQYLSTLVDSLGRKLLYRGIYPDE